MLELLTVEAPDWLDHDTPLEFVTCVNDMSDSTTYNAIKRARILQHLRREHGWGYPECVEAGLKIADKTYHHLLHVLKDKRMYRTDWRKPKRWGVYRDLSYFPDRVFEAVKDYLFEDISKPQLSNLRELYAARFQQRHMCDSDLKPQAQPTKWLNRIIHGDCMDLIPELEDESMSLVVTSPPYAEQRDQFDGVPEAEYPEWFARLMGRLHPKLTEDGSVLVVIAPHVDDRQVSGYVDAIPPIVRRQGWIEPDKLYWLKPDAPPLGAQDRPRRQVENILWFSKSRGPYVNVTACGKPSTRIGHEYRDSKGNIHGTSPHRDGIARITNCFTVPCGALVDRDVDHPAMFPAELVRRLILTFGRPGCVVLDPFVGSGTTCLVAQSLDYGFIGFDNSEKFAEMATRRLHTEPRYCRPTGR
ncbi:MAG TPA: site-specific DNA-methyltransferase [Candidatus Limnocylindrales bacterium]|nr:site-specific DNA-methyltransferase [Candidatus Limnocylindrales bacterium]